MTPEQMVAAVRKYDTQLAEGGFEPVRCDPDAEDIPTVERFEHVRWMCQQVPGFVETGRLEKAHRWVGFIQGVLWALKVGTISSFKEDNR